MRKRLLIVFLGLSGLLLVAYWEVFGYSDGNQKIDTARTQMDFFAKQCKAFRARSQPNDKYPASLRDLVLASEGRRPMVDGGEATLINPWGQEYRYAVGETVSGQVIYIWCERIENGNMTGFGIRLTPEGILQRFSITDD